MTIIINKKTLTKLPTNVSVPLYDRSRITPGIVHIGVGNFHRAHQAVYLDRLFNEGLDHDWGIIGAGIKPADVKMRERLGQQDWLSSVIELDPAGYTARVSGALVGFAEVSAQGLIEALSKPEIRIVSLTITEGGYYIDPKTGGFDVSHPEILYDIQNPLQPLTVFGALVLALKHRKSTGLNPFTILSCDNLPGNGEATKHAVVGLALAMAPDIANWIDTNVAFPNSMVDCITPATGEREYAMAEETFGIEDAGVVVCEPFRQWVIEDHFPQGRPALEKVGVEFVADVASFELMKLRILNGGHAAIAYPSALLGLTYAHEAMAHPLIQRLLDKIEYEEIIPTVPAVPNVDFNQYFEQTKKRFANPEIGDTIVRLCLDGSNRQPKFILPTIADRLDQNLPIKGLALEVAMWCRFCAGVDDMDHPLEINDMHAERLQAQARLAREAPSAFLSMTDIFGPLSSDKIFEAEFTQALQSLWRKGTVTTIEAYLNGDTSQ